MILIGGGQEYYGPTAQRDKQIVQETAKHLYDMVGNSIEIVTGGMPGIPMDFAQMWMKCGGNRVRFIVSEEYAATLTEHMENVLYEPHGKTQSERRQYLTTISEITVAFFVQGGQFTTDEIIKCQARPEVETICFIGSGGASGGAIPYNGALPTFSTLPDWIRDSDPNSDPIVLGKSFAHLIFTHHKGKQE